MGAIKNMTSRRASTSPNGTYYKNNYFTNPESTANLIYFIMRPHNGEKMLGYGAWGAVDFLTPDDMITQFLYVQQFWYIESRRGKRMYHEIFTLYDQDVAGENDPLDYQDLWNIGVECAGIYFNEGHQVVFAIHQSREQGYHIHFAVNSVSFRDGRKFRTNKLKRMEREGIFNTILRNHQKKMAGSLLEMTAPEDDSLEVEDIG